MIPERHYTAKASLSVEAAIALPLFVMAVLSLAFLFRVMAVEHRIQAAMDTAAERASIYVYLADHRHSAEEIGSAEGKELEEMILSGGLTAAYLLGKTVYSAGADWLNASPVVGGVTGLNPIGSALPDNEGNIDFVLNYRVRIPLIPGKPGEIWLSQRVCRRIWGGTTKSAKEEKKEEEQIVYVTEQGTVYHISRDCSHLRLSTRMVNIEELSNIRSSDGSVYYPCERCGSQLAGVMVYITEDGNRYHSSLDCPGLKRTIREIGLSQAGNRNRCKTCGGE